VSALVDGVVAAYGRIDIVVSNAGTHLAGRLEDVETRALLNHLETKVMGAWELAKCVVPHMRRQGGGRFIVIIGQAGKVPQANGSLRPSAMPLSTLW
jgi:NAD(P)-dependent dehydrogenase (short-subunit alcohol dehydrogenase family)